MTSTHTPFRELIAGGLDCPLDAAERAALADHVAGCASCRALEHQLRSDAALLAAPVTVTPPARIRVELERRVAIPDVDPGLLRVLRIAVATALLLLLVVAFAILSALAEPRPVDPLATTEPAPAGLHGLGGAW